MVSEVVMEDFLEQGSELLDDLLLQSFGESPPELSWGAGHGASHSFNRASRSRRAALVNCVRSRAGLSGFRLVAGTGMRRRMWSR
jgi:hypothetical protein